jgi:DNA-binding GntR family transcriptional regulator
MPPRNWRSFATRRKEKGEEILVKEMGVSKTVIYRAIAELAAKNLLRRQRRGQGKSCLYKLFDPVE